MSSDGGEAGDGDSDVGGDGCDDDCWRDGDGDGGNPSGGPGDLHSLRCFDAAAPAAVGLPVIFPVASVLLRGGGMASGADGVVGIDVIGTVAAAATTAGAFSQTVTVTGWPGMMVPGAPASLYAATMSMSAEFMFFNCRG